MFITTTPAPNGAHGTLTLPQVASMLGISVAGARKLVDAGVLTKPTPVSAVASLAARSSLHITDGEITVLRTGPQVLDDTDPDRVHMGYDEAMTDQEAEDGNLRWWRCEPERVLRSGLFLVTISTIPLALYEVTNCLTPDSAPRHHFAGNLIARHVGEQGTWRAASQPTVITADEVNTIMSSRVYTRSGGPIAYLGDR